MASGTDDLVMFSQLLIAARSSGLPLSEGLQKCSRDLAGSKAEAWSKILSQRLQAGHSLADSVKGLEGIDPLLGKILSLPDGNGLSRVLASYTRHLILFQTMVEQLKSALFYPFLVFCLAVVNLCIINIYLFPSMELLYQGQTQPLPMIVRCLFIFNPDTWPLSFPLPMLIFAIPVVLFRLFFLDRISDISGLRRLPIPGFSGFVLAEARGRLQGAIALFLEAGETLANCIRYAREFSGYEGDVHGLENIAEALEQGHPPSRSLESSDLLVDVSRTLGESGKPDNFLQTFSLASEANLAEAARFPAVIESLGGVLAVILAGFVVGILCVAFFDPYFSIFKAIG